jgi:hypothetical protein
MFVKHQSFSFQWLLILNIGMYLSIVLAVVVFVQLLNRAKMFEVGLDWNCRSRKTVDKCEMCNISNAWRCTWCFENIISLLLKGFDVFHVLHLRSWRSQVLKCMCIINKIQLLDYAFKYVLNSNWFDTVSEYYRREPRAFNFATPQWGYIVKRFLWLYRGLDKIIVCRFPNNNCSFFNSQTMKYQIYRKVERIVFRNVICKKL